MLSKRRRTLVFLEAGILTFLVFLFSIMVNSFLDDKRIYELNEGILKSSIETDVFLAGNEFNKVFEVDTLLIKDSYNSCDFRKNKILLKFKGLKELGTDITNYGSLFLQSNEDSSEFKKREYFLEELGLYSNLLDYNEDCSERIMPLIYFYNGFSTELDKQSLILEQFALNHKNETMIFSFDFMIFSEPILESLKDELNVSTVPFIFLNEKGTYSLLNDNGVVSLNTITLEFNKFNGGIE